MKKQLFTLFAIFIGITLMSSDCGGGDGDGGVSPLIGTWVIDADANGAVSSGDGTAFQGSTNVTADYIGYSITFQEGGGYSIVVYDYFGAQQASGSGTYTDNGTSITLSAHENLSNVSTASGLSFTQAVAKPSADKADKVINYTLVKR